MDIYEESLEMHEKWKGKIEVTNKAPINDKRDLSVAYSPGVAAPCIKISENKNDAYKYTWKGNTIAVVSDGSAVLGLGNIGAEAALPVMEGKAALFKRFGDVNAIPIVLDTQEPDEIINIVKKLAPTFGGINLEDISSPRCVTIERKLIEELNIPVFHDDQHGTAIVVTAALINGLKFVNKKAEDCVATVSGAGAAGYSIIKMLKDLGISNIYAFDSRGILSSKNKENYNFVKKEILEITNNSDEDLTLADSMKKSDIFIGVSAGNILNKEMVSSMKKDAIVLAMANPEPEISYYDAKEAGAAIVGTGRSDYPNQINNVLVFPGIFKGALEVHASKISEAMKMAAAEGIASIIPEDQLREDFIVPSAFDNKVAERVATAVKEKALEQDLIIK